MIHSPLSSWVITLLISGMPLILAWVTVWMRGSGFPVFSSSRLMRKAFSPSLSNFVGKAFSTSSSVTPSAFILSGSKVILTAFALRSTLTEPTMSSIMVYVSFWATSRANFSLFLCLGSRWIVMTGVDGVLLASTISMRRGRPRVTFCSATPA